MTKKHLNFLTSSLKKYQNLELCFIWYNQELYISLINKKTDQNNFFGFKYNDKFPF